MLVASGVLAADDPAPAVLVEALSGLELEHPARGRASTAIPTVTRTRVLLFMVVLSNWASARPAPRPAIRPDRPYTRIRCRSTLMPTRRALSSFEPIAYVYRPNFVLCRTIPPMITVISATKGRDGIPRILM